MRWLLLPVLAVALFATPLAGSAQSVTLPNVPYTESISGVPITFTGSGTLVPEANCTRVNATLAVTLGDLASKLTQIVRNSGVVRSEACGDSVVIHGANLWRHGNNLRVKVDGNVARQECVVTKIPEFRGLRITFKNRTVASNTFRTNASVEAVVAPVVSDDNKLATRIIEGPTTRVSNDAYRFLIGTFNLQGRIDSAVARTLADALSSDNAMLVLPEELQQIGLKLTNASIVDRSGQPALQVEGHVPIPDDYAAVARQLFGHGGCR